MKLRSYMRPIFFELCQSMLVRGIVLNSTAAVEFHVERQNRFLQSMWNERLKLKSQLVQGPTFNRHTLVAVLEVETVVKVWIYPNVLGDFLHYFHFTRHEVFERPTSYMSFRHHS